jgi:hypothetical protein
MRVFVLLAAALAVALAPRIAVAEELENWLVGPLIGVRLGNGAGSPLVLGLEGGYGLGPERINLGFEHRSEKLFFYGELDPWYLLGGSLGFGVDEDGAVHPVLGVWEGIPLLPKDAPCSGWHSQVTLSGGYRYTGVHELYLSIKAGVMNGDFCFEE